MDKKPPEVLRRAVKWPAHKNPLSGFCEPGLGSSAKGSQNSYWASSNEDWQEGHSKTPSVSWNGHLFTISNFRNFRHSKNGSEGGFESRTFDLSKVSGMEIFSIPFGKTWKFSHLIGSFLFDDGRRLALSIEARRRPGEDFSAIRGLFGHFGLSYVWGSESDLIGMRIFHRKDTVERFVFPLERSVVKQALKHLLSRTESLSKCSENYHSLLKNCTTELLSPLIPGFFWKFSPNTVRSSNFWKVLERFHGPKKQFLLTPENVSEKIEGTEFSKVIRSKWNPKATGCKNTVSEPLVTYRYFLLFLFCTVVWTFAFGAAKYFLWALWKDSLEITLEYVAGYLAVGSAAAYLLWGYAVRRLGMRATLVFSGLFGTALFSFLWQFERPWTALLATSVTAFGFSYGTWVVARSVLASMEIRRTGLPDTAVTGAMNVAFIVSVILGSILGGKLAETFFANGYVFLILSMVIATTAAFFFSGKEFFPDPDFHSSELVSGIIRWKKVFFRHGNLLVPVVLLWSLSTVASQQVVQTSVELFWKTPSEAALVLLYSSFGAIVGNALSARLEKFRWKSFQAFNFAFALSLAAIPFTFEYAKAAGTYVPIIAIAVLIGFFFATAANLAEGFYFRKIEEENEKEFGSSLYGIVLASALSGTMAGIGALTEFHSWKTVFFVLAAMSIVLSIPVTAYAKKLNGLEKTKK